MVAAACTELGLYLTSAGKAVPFHTLGALQSQPPSELEASQITINTEARDAIKDLFPNIPQDDLFQIIKTAFQKVSQFEPSVQKQSRSQMPDLSAGSAESRHSNGAAFGPQGTISGGGAYSASLH